MLNLHHCDYFVTTDLYFWIFSPVSHPSKPPLICNHWFVLCIYESPSVLFVYFVIYIPHISEIIWYLSFSNLLHLFHSRPIYVLTNGKILFWGGFGWGRVEGWGEKAHNCNWITIKNLKKRFYSVLWSSNIPLYISTTTYLIIYWWALKLLPYLSYREWAAMNIGVLTSFWISIIVFLGYNAIHTAMAG